MKSRINSSVKGNYQNDSYSCGAWAFKHALECFGMTIGIKKAKKLCKTTSYLSSACQNLTPGKLLSNPCKAFNKFYVQIGTDEDGIKHGIINLKLKFKEHFSYSYKSFLHFLNKALLNGPVILFVNYDQDAEDSGHWIVCIQKSNNRYMIIDSAPYSGNTKKLYSEKELLDRFWWIDEEDDYYCYYGLALKL